MRKTTASVPAPKPVVETVKPEAAAAAAPEKMASVAAPAAGAAAASPSSDKQSGSFLDEPRPDRKSSAATLGGGAILAGKLLLVLGLAWLSVGALKLFYTRSARPLKFGTRTLHVEESSPLGAGASVHLVRIGRQRWLVGTAQGQVNILAAVDEEGAMQEADAANGGPDILAVLGGLQQKMPLAQRRKDREAAAEPSESVAHSLRGTSSFLEELRDRMNTPASV